MSAGSEAVLYDIFGDPMAVEINTAIPTGTASLVSAGSDGTNARYIKVDSSGNQVIIGLGTAGAQTGGVLTIQGDPSATPVPVTGTFNATNPSVGLNDTTVPGSSTQIGGTDGTNLRSLRVFDLDSGGGQQWILGVGLRKSAGGGSVEFGTSSDPIRIDPTGTTTQPVSGTVTVTQSTPANLRAQTSSESNTGSAVPTQATMVGGSDGTNLRAIFVDSSGRQIIIGAAAAGAAAVGNPVLTAGNVTTAAPSYSNNTVNYLSLTTAGALRVDGSDVTQPISGTVTSNQGTANSLANGWPVKITDGTNTMPTGDAVARALFEKITDGTNTAAVKAASTAAVTADPSLVVALSPNSSIPTGSNTIGAVTGTASDNGANSTLKLPVLGARANASPPSWTEGNQVPLSALLAGQIRIDNTSWLGSTAPTVGQKTKTNSIPVTMASDQPAIAVDGYTDVGSLVQNPPVTIGGVDDDGYVRNLHLDSSGNLNVVVSLFDAAAYIGLIAGLVTLGGSSGGSQNAIRATTYNEQSSNAQRSIKSSSASDTAAGTGAREVEIVYYKSDGYGPFIETITLNGTTPVNTVNTDICFIEKITVTKLGSGVANVGTITLNTTTGGGGSIIGTIGIGSLVASVGDNKTLWAHHYVPPGKTVSLATVILSNFGGTGSGITTMILKAKQIGVANAAEIMISDLIAVPTGQAIVRQLGIPIRVIGPSRILGYTIPASNNTTSELSFDFSEI